MISDALAEIEETDARVDAPKPHMGKNIAHGFRSGTVLFKQK
jgi:hypothetical protein